MIPAIDAMKKGNSKSQNHFKKLKKNVSRE